jgi:Uncharacterised nucleotidyltransferase
VTRRRAGHRPPAPLPPSTDPAAWSVVRAVAAHGLSGAPAIPSLEVSGARFDQVLRLAERQRVLGLLAAASADGTLELDDQDRLELSRTHQAWCAHDLRLERALLTATVALAAAAIPALVTKGPALAHQVYPDPAQRLFADLDLIVTSGQVHAAADVLAEALGAARVQGELRPGFDERFGKETLLRTPATTTAPAGLEIDVHRTPVAGALGLAIPLDELFDHPARFDLAGLAVTTPGPVPSVLLAAYQATVADIPPRLGARRDLVQLLARPDLDLDAVVAAAGRWQARAVLAEAVSQTWSTLGLAAPAPLGAPAITAWATGYRPTAGERLLLQAHRANGYVYWRQLAGVVVLSGWDQRARYGAALVWPGPGYLRDRSWSMGQHLRRALHTVDAPIRHRLVAVSRRLGRRLRRWRASR